MSKITNFLNEYGKILTRSKSVKKTNIKTTDKKKRTVSDIPVVNLNYIKKTIELFENLKNIDDIVETLLKAKPSKRKYNLYFDLDKKITRKKIYTNLLKWTFFYDLLKIYGYKEKFEINKFDINIPSTIHFGKTPLSLCSHIDALITEITYSSNIGLNNRVIVQLLIDDGVDLKLS